MDVVLNGTQRQIEDASTVADVIELLGYTGRQVVVELNGEPLERERYGDVTLRVGDRIEIVRAVAGG